MDNKDVCNKSSPLEANSPVSQKSDNRSAGSIRRSRSRSSGRSRKRLYKVLGSRYSVGSRHHSPSRSGSRYSRSPSRSRTASRSGSCSRSRSRSRSYTRSYTYSCSRSCDSYRSYSDSSSHSHHHRSPRSHSPSASHSHQGSVGSCTSSKVSSRKESDSLSRVVIDGKDPRDRSKRVHWENRICLIGEKVLEPNVHICDICDLPIVVYGRLIPCKHVVCYTCSSSLSGYCRRCQKPFQGLDRCIHGGIFMCFEEATCRRTYLSQRDLQAHISHRHKHLTNNTNSEKLLLTSSVASATVIPVTTSSIEPKPATVVSCESPAPPPGGLQSSVLAPQGQMPLSIYSQCYLAGQPLINPVSFGPQSMPSISAHALTRPVLCIQPFPGHHPLPAHQSLSQTSIVSSSSPNAMAVLAAAAAAVIHNPQGNLCNASQRLLPPGSIWPNTNLQTPHIHGPL